MSDIVVNISRTTGGVTRAGFGTALILSSTAQTFKTYSDLTELQVDFGTSTTVYKMASALMGQSIQPQQFAVAGIAYTAGTDPVTDLSDFLNTLVADGKDFYLVLQEQDDVASQEEVSTWANTQIKLHFIRVSDLPASYTGTLSNRTAVFYGTTADEYPDAAVAGYGLPKDPGSLTWKNIEISGITAEVLTGANETALETGRFNSIVTKYGRVVTTNGYLQGSLFIDQQRSQDYISTRMEENLAQLLINNDKIPYDDTGIAQVVSVVTKTLNQAGNNGIIARDSGGNLMFSVSSTARSDIPQQDIDDRVLRTVTFKYVEAGAVEGVEITGKIVAEL